MPKNVGDRWGEEQQSLACQGSAWTWQCVSVRLTPVWPRYRPHAGQPPRLADPLTAVMPGQSWTRKCPLTLSLRQ